MWPFNVKSWNGLVKKLNNFLADYGSWALLLNMKKANHALKKDLKSLNNYAVYIKFNRALSPKDDKYVDDIIKNTQIAAKRLKVRL